LTSTSSTSRDLTIPDDAAPGIPAPENKVYYPALDGLRAFAILLVFAQHYFLTFYKPYLQWGWTGVDIFFVLSGFLITGILFDTRNDAHRFRVFYIRRSLRIFPLYYGIFAVVLLLTPVLHWAWSSVWVLWPIYLGNYDRFLNVHAFFLNHGLIDNLFSPVAGYAIYFGHFWSLCVEEQFYLVWPFVVFLLRDRVRLRNLCVAVVILMPFIRLIVGHFLSQELLDAGIFYRATPFRVDALLLGGLIALELRGPNAERLRRLAAPIFISASITCLLAWGFAVGVLHQSVSAGETTPWIATFGFTLVDFIAAGALLLTLQPGNIFYRVFTIKPLRRLGQISYGFYVFHDIPHVFYDSLARTVLGSNTQHIHIPVAMLIAFICTTALSLLSFRLFEAPFLRLKNRLAMPS
jgi:peptidoglycan/LPS O-acetylase OafA/YrhL